MVSVVIMFRPSVAAYGNESFFMASEYMKEMASKRNRKMPFIISESSNSMEEMNKRDMVRNKIISDQVRLTETDEISKNKLWKSLISKHKSRIIQGEKKNSRSDRFRSFLKKFCNSTSLHGFHYLVEQERSYYERTFWILALCGVYVSCFLLIKHSVSNWLDSPAIISIENKPVPVGLIPFPAVTICGMNQINQSVFNDSVYYGMSIAEKTNLNQTFLNKMDYVNVVCGKEMLFRPSLDILDLNIFHDMVNNLHTTCEDSLLFAKWSNYTLENPCDYMQPVLTEIGLCYTFNMLPLKVLLTDYYFEVIQMYNYVKKLSTWSKIDKVDWTPEKEYSNLPRHDDIPKRTSGTGLNHAFTMALKIKEDGIDPFCNFGYSGYTVLIHSPAEMPTAAFARIGTNMNRFNWITVMPRRLRTSTGVKMWSPQNRGCYFDHERKLFYFKLYSQVNCNLECESNYSMKSCGCVAFYHPRTLFTPICGGRKTDCIEDSLVKFAELNVKKKGGCGCLPSCTNLEYDIDVLSLDDINLKKFQGVLASKGLRKSKISVVAIAYKKRHTMGLLRSGMYGFTDFLGNVGGIMGLFLGFSWFSLLEIVYFLVIRPIANRRNRIHQETQ